MMIMGGGGMDPAGMMMGVALGSVMGRHMAGTMNNAMEGMQQAAAPVAAQPAPSPVVQYSIAVNGQTLGPFNMNVLAQMAQSGQLTRQSQVWKQGMSGWAAAGTVQELSGLFTQNAPPPPPPPPPPAP